MLHQYDLPDVGYPVPVDAYSGLLAGAGPVSIEHLLYWIQEYSAESGADWRGLQAASLRLTELLAPNLAATHLGVFYSLCSES